MLTALPTDTRLGELWPDIWQATGETLLMVALTMLIGGTLGLLLGLGLYLTRRGGLYQNVVVSTILNVLVNFFRPIPFIIFIAAVQPAARLIVGTGIGTPAVVFSLVLAAMFGIARIVEQNLVSVPPGVIEAARAMGATRARIAATVVVPEAMAPVILGYTFAFVAVVDMSAVAGLIAGGGLGSFAQTFGYRQYDPAVTWVCVLILVALVQVIQLLGNTLSARILRR
ncbi:methionine ABC transporter permease [Nocardioides sp. NPDC057772]|uniref:methionine ABC transporter permease n=1 Tax=Nocardioides sp. NPDC057772 TaxID=3346245 RepID=UPI00366F4200